MPDSSGRAPDPQIPRDYELLISGATRNIETRIRGMEDLLNERDRRYTSLFEGSEKSVKTALDAAEKAVNAALVAAEKAVGKAEVSQDKRNSEQNEFRGQLRDQAATFLARAEAETVFRQLRELVDDNKKDLGTVREQIVTISSRQNYDDKSGLIHTAKMDITMSTVMSALATIVAVAVLIVLIVHG